MSDARTHFSAGEPSAGNGGEAAAFDAYPNRGGQGAAAGSAPGAPRANELEADELEAERLAVGDLAVDDLALDDLEVEELAAEEADVAEAQRLQPGAPSVEAQRDEYLNTLRHLQADFENYKKRVAKQQADLFERANEGLVLKLLPVLDTADLAQVHGAGEAVSQLRASLLDVLGKAGLERLAPDGGPFDPNLHDAVAHEPGNGGDQEVAEVLRAGYRWNGRVLRPAMVRVRG